MTRRAGAFAAQFSPVFGLVLVGIACDPIQAPAAAIPPGNACPAHPCASYNQAGPPPSCTDGACFVEGARSDLLLAIGLAEDSIFAPSGTYLTTLGRGTSPTCALANPCALQDCTPPNCVLCPWVVERGWYVFDPQQANVLGSSLGNSPTLAAIPSHATYRRLMGPSMVDAVDRGLPVGPVQTDTDNPFFGGPNGSSVPQFRAYMQPGCYERTIQPDLPFSSAFPPEIKLWVGPTPEQNMAGIDVTTEETGLAGNMTIVPTFDIARAEGLDGWTAYLRNTATKQIFSNVARLSGSLAKNVVLATNHAPPPGDALTGLELVVAPPRGVRLPVAVFAPQGTAKSKGLDALEEYPSLPLPLKTVGTVTADGTPMAADLVFTATSIFNGMGTPYPPNFEFVTEVRTTQEGQTSEWTYSVDLPQGDYFVAVRPLGGGALTTKNCTVRRQGSTTPCGDVVLASLVAVTGSAVVADGRPLSNALVEAVPTQCASSPSSTGLAPDASVMQPLPDLSAADACMPSAAQTTTATDGTFSLNLDPGQYLLRVRPADGSRLPWVNQPLAVPVASPPIPLAAIAVPAPLRVAMNLTDTSGNAITNASIRVFTDPTRSGARAIELGRAITDGAGSYEIVVAPGAQ